MSSEFQVLVIGGGPAGAAVASLLSMQGHAVALFEKSSFPRFHVGESLVPAVNRTLEKLGVLDQMLESSFPRKQGVQFFSPKGPTKPFYFEEIGEPILDGTWQVLRQDFDCLLLDRAR
ncbi:MAG: NAD(P)/FAD-dependent oxidoreductase, partial [Planctomycetota bacterium]